ncbi:MAG: YhdP family protein, partial [Dokdonella sp.]
SVSGAASLRTLSTSRSVLDRIAFVARWQRDNNDWTLDLADLVTSTRVAEEPSGRLHVQYRSGGHAKTSVSASDIDVAAIAQLAMHAERVPNGARAWIAAALPGGRVEDAALEWRTNEDFNVDATLDALMVRSVGKIPGAQRLAARLRGDARALLLEIPRQPVRIDYPHSFRQPFELTRFGGDVVIWRDDASWRVNTPGFAIESQDFSIDISGGIELQGDGSRPSLDLTALVSQAQVVAAKRFWTINTMTPRTIDWLDRALQGGRIVEGRVVFVGDLDDWPFRGGEGRFEGRADIEGLELDYLREWPRGENIDVVARFINNGMQASLRKGSTRSIIVDSAEASIASFAESIFDLRVTAHAPGATLLDYLRATPVGKTHESSLRGLRIGGQGMVDISMTAPLKQNERLALDGRVDLVDADLNEANWALDFVKANGTVAFTRSGVSAPALEVLYDGRPATLGVAIGTATAESANAIEASLIAVLPVATVFARAIDLVPAFPLFPGEARWNVGLAIGVAKPGEESLKTLHLSSDLRGIAMDLPQPLAKAAETALPFALALEIPPLGKPFRASLGDVLSIHGRLPAPMVPLAARLDFGGAGATGEVPERGIAIGGRVGALDAGGWIALLGGDSGNGSRLHSLAIDVGDLQLADRHFTDTRVAIGKTAQGTTITLAGDAIDGVVTVPSANLERAGITAQMKHLQWPDPPPEKHAATDMLAGIAPASIPPLHVWVGALRFGNANFGEARLETYPVAQGMQIERLETESPSLGMRASGSWTGNAADTRSALSIDMTSQDLGLMLAALGFNGVIDGGQTLAHIDAAWPGAPAAFALANVTGKLDISVDKGRILDVDPGAGGRLFGLLSLREIPRRLSLDFSDLFKSGMSFNAINGSFDLRDGNAFTDNLHINSPAADIRISGRTGLRSKDYEQQMEVTPRAGVTLPLVGALAAGPVGAAAGLVMQGLLGKQINQAARSRYEVTGSWEKPVITLLERDDPKSAPSPPLRATVPEPDP